MDGTVIVHTSGITNVPEILSREGFQKYSHNFYTFYLYTCTHAHTHARMHTHTHTHTHLSLIHI